ncbi:MAG: nitroreductase family protein [Promethearchaeota archaeon]
MKVKEAIESRRSYRLLDPVKITNGIISDLGNSARLSPSCFNNQPWKYIFIYDELKLRELQEAISKKNKRVKRASLIIAVFSKQENDCNVGEREYYLFDTGMATAFLILRATELGLVAHLIAGFNEERAKEILKIPKNMRLITLVIIGKHSEEINESMTDSQKSQERVRPQRKELSEFISIDNYNNQYKQ